MSAAVIIRGDALRLPLADESVDLVITSPPYFGLRSYRDDGEHYAGQIGSEDTPQQFLDALWSVTAECMRVLKPSGSIFVNLGDKYAGSGGHNNAGITGGPSQLAGSSARYVDRLHDIAKGGRRPPRELEPDASVRASRRQAPDAYNKQTIGGARAKSLMLLPERYRIGCVDQLDLIARAVIVWHKPNGLPESVTDRVRRSHEEWVHLTKEPHYFTAIDEIRETYTNGTAERYALGFDKTKRQDAQITKGYDDSDGGPSSLNPLGRLPGSVWSIASEPLIIPEWGPDVDHFAAFPQEWPRRLVLGFSPIGICTRCGARRSPKSVVAEREPNDRLSLMTRARTSSIRGTHVGSTLGYAAKTAQRHIVSYACACADSSAPTRPAVVLDPFAGTGTTVGVARALGRIGIGVDLSADYCRLAHWRVFRSGHFAKTLRRTNESRQGAML